MVPPRKDVIVQASCGKDEKANCFSGGDGSLFTQCFVTNLFKRIVEPAWKCIESKWVKNEFK